MTITPADIEQLQEQLHQADTATGVASGLMSPKQRTRLETRARARINGEPMTTFRRFVSNTLISFAVIWAFARVIEVAEQLTRKRSPAS